MKTTWFVIFCSPSGSTKHVAEVIADSVRALPVEVHVLDLGKEREWSQVLNAIQAAGKEACLCIGSPVYRDLAVSPVMRFIDALPAQAGGYAVPFITWGAAASGIALWQMGTALQNKGFSLAGAAKVLGVHALMWGADTPLGEGHPDAQEDLAVSELVRTVNTRLTDDTFTGIPLAQLDYQPAEKAEEMKKKLLTPPSTTPRTVNESTCTQCEICANECPTDAITFDPFPVFNEQCIDCFNCIRSCPEGAIEPKVPLATIHEMIRKRSAMMNEDKKAETW